MAQEDILELMIDVNGDDDDNTITDKEAMF